jgi:N-acetylmuramoyl-L-alanine amidase
MSSRNTLQLSTLILFGIIGSSAVTSARGDSTDIVVIYPKAGQTVTASDSTFILGHLTRTLLKNVPASAGINDRLSLKINGQTVSVHSGGGFLAFLPIIPGDFTFKLKVTGGGKHAGLTTLAELDLPVKVAGAVAILPTDSLMIGGDYRPPLGDIALPTGDRLDVQFRGTPGGMAWFSIPEIVDSVPMSETATAGVSPYWGEAVFGEGVVPESTAAGGIYAGFWKIPESVGVSGENICYHLCRRDSVSNTLKHITAVSGYKVSLNSPQFPFTIRLTDSVQTMRVGPRLGYYSIYQPRGVEVLAVGAEADWYRVKLSSSQHAWVARNSVERLSPGILPTSSKLTSVRSYDSSRFITLTFPLAGRHPYRVIEESPRRLVLQLFGVTSNTDWIRSEFRDSLVDYCTWIQREDNLYEFSINLRRPLWGYDCYYDGSTFCLKIIKPPKNVRTLKGKTVVVDAGHSADPGSIGPTGFTEAEANLGIAVELKRLLVARGAKVVMTRNDMSNVPLADRPGIAISAGADLYVSVHNNSLPDGVNPFDNNGTSVIYYHPWSVDLARSILGELLKATKLPDHGLYWGNLAVNRPTQYPAVLVECDFMILPDREAMLRTKAYHSKLAGAIAAGIELYLRNYPNGR